MSEESIIIGDVVGKDNPLLFWNLNYFNPEWVKEVAYTEPGVQPVKKRGRPKKQEGVYSGNRI